MSGIPKPAFLSLILFFEGGDNLPGEALDLRLALRPMGHHELKRDVFHADVTEAL